MNKMLTSPAPMLNSKPPAKDAPRSKKMIARKTLTRPSETADTNRRFEKTARAEKAMIKIMRIASCVMIGFTQVKQIVIGREFS